jgi:hypothetical protein
MSDYAFPTERIELPSKGKLYPETSSLKKGYVDIKYLSAKEEDILTNRNYISQDIVIDKLFEAMIATPNVKLSELLPGDDDAIFYACRVLAYGTEYQYRTFHPQTGKDDIGTIDLNEINNKPLDPVIENAQYNEFEFILPQAKIPVTFKLLTRGDREQIKAEEKNWLKLFPEKTYNRALFLIHSLTSVDGNKTPSSIREFVDKGIMTALDASKLRQYIQKIAPGLDTKVKVTYSDGFSQEAEVPITSTFLWPDSI